MKLLVSLSLFVFILASCTFTSTKPEAAVTPGQYQYQDFAYDLVWSPDDNLLAATTNTGLYVYDAKTYSQLAVLDNIGGSTVAFGKEYLAAINNHGLQVWTLKDFKILFHVEQDPNNGFQSLAISPDEKTLAAANQNQVRLWSIPDGKMIATLNNVSLASDMKFGDGDGLIIASPYFGKIQEWDIKSQKMIHSFEFPKPVVSLRLSADGKEVIVDYGLTGFELWNVDAGKLQQNYGDIVSASGWQRLSGDNHYVVVWGYAFDGKNSGLSVWDMQVHVHLQEFTTPFVNGDGWRCGALNSDGSILAASNNEGYINFYDVGSGKELGKIYLPYKFIVGKG